MRVLLCNQIQYLQFQEYRRMREQAALRLSYRDLKYSQWLFLGSVNSMVRCNCHILFNLS